jgi:hypothetical protein
MRGETRNTHDILFRKSGDLHIPGLGEQKWIFWKGVVKI